MVELLDLGKADVDLRRGRSRAARAMSSRQPVQRLRAEHDVDVRRAPDDGRAFLARDAAADADDEVGLAGLERAHAAEVVEHALLRLLAHRAGVEQDDVGVLGAVGERRGRRRRRARRPSCPSRTRSSGSRTCGCRASWSRLPAPGRLVIRGGPRCRQEKSGIITAVARDSLSLFADARTDDFCKVDDDLLRLRRRLGAQRPTTRSWTRGLSKSADDGAEVRPGAVEDRVLADARHASRPSRSAASSSSSPPSRARVVAGVALLEVDADLQVAAAPAGTRSESVDRLRAVLELLAGDLLDVRLGDEPGRGPARRRAARRAARQARATMEIRITHAASWSGYAPGCAALCPGTVESGQQVSAARFSSRRVKRERGAAAAYDACECRGCPRNGKARGPLRSTPLSRRRDGKAERPHGQARRPACARRRSRRRAPSRSSALAVRGCTAIMRSRSMSRIRARRAARSLSSMRAFPRRLHRSPTSALPIPSP